MGVTIPTTYTIDHVGHVGPVSIDGIPSTFDINIDKLPKVSLGVDPVHVSVDALPKISIGVDPVDISLRLKEVPSVRTHLPVDFRIGLAILGIDLLSLRLCGEAQMITEPFRPNPCEVCGENVTTRPQPLA